MLLHLLFNQINADLVSIKYFVQKHWKKYYRPQTFEWQCISLKKKKVTLDLTKENEVSNSLLPQCKKCFNKIYSCTEFQT